MMPKTRTEITLYVLAFVMPLLYFLNLPFSPERSTPELMNHFFGADCWRVLENLRDRTIRINHYRDQVHPYFSLFAVSISKPAAIINIEGAEFLLYRTVFGTLGVFLFWLLIFSETRQPLIAFSAVLLLLSTFTVRVWSILPETSLFGFFTLMFSLILIRARSGVPAVFIVSLSGTITNTILGMSYLIRQFNFRKQLFNNLLYIVFSIAILSMLQRMLFPTSAYFFNVLGLIHEHEFLNNTTTSTPFRLFDFIYSGFVIPLPDSLTGTVLSQVLWGMFFDNAVAGYSQVVTLGVGLVLAIIPALLCAAIYKFYKDPAKSEIGIYVLVFLAFQFLLNMVYGDIPFLYSYNFLPMMLLFIILYLPRNTITVTVLIVFSAILQQIQGAQLERFNQIFG